MKLKQWSVAIENNLIWTGHEVLTHTHTYSRTKSNDNVTIRNRMDIDDDHTFQQLIMNDKFAETNGTKIGEQFTNGPPNVC